MTDSVERMGPNRERGLHGQDYRRSATVVRQDVGGAEAAIQRGHALRAGDERLAVYGERRLAQGVGRRGRPITACDRNAGDQGYAEYPARYRVLLAVVNSGWSAGRQIQPAALWIGPLPTRKLQRERPPQGSSMARFRGAYGGGLRRNRIQPPSSNTTAYPAIRRSSSITAMPSYASNGHGLTLALATMNSVAGTGTPGSRM